MWGGHGGSQEATRDCDVITITVIVINSIMIAIIAVASITGSIVMIVVR